MYLSAIQTCMGLNSADSAQCRPIKPRLVHSETTMTSHSLCMPKWQTLSAFKTTAGIKALENTYKSKGHIVHSI